MRRQRCVVCVLLMLELVLLPLRMMLLLQKLLLFVSAQEGCVARVEVLVHQPWHHRLLGALVVVALAVVYHV